MPGTLFVVATPIGNLEDITGRALRVLRDAALIAAEDTRHTARLLARYAIKTPTTSLHAHNERQKAASLIERLQHGDNVALVSDAGTPTVSDPGEQLVRMALEEGIRVEPIPGPSAALAALSASGLPAGSFTFLGFPPIRSKDRKSWLDELKHAGHTVVFFEAPHRLRATLEDIQRTVGDQSVFIARELTKVHEQLVKEPISAALERFVKPRGEFVVVIEIGLSTDNNGTGRPAAGLLYKEFCQLTENASLTRRMAIAKLSKRYSIPSSEIYELIEQQKKLGKQHNPGRC